MKRSFFLLPLLAVGVATAQTKEIRGIEITPDVIYGHKMGLALSFDVLKPKANGNGRGILFMVSGGWVSPWTDPAPLLEKSLEKKDIFAKILDRGYTLFLVRHGSSPVFKVPEAVEDVRRATRYIRLNAAQFAIDGEKLGVCGSSAGGHLALMLGTASDSGKADKDDPVEKTSSRVAAVVAYFPPTTLESFVGDKRFPAADFDPALTKSVSPIDQVSADDPPTLLIHGAKDELVKLDHSQNMEKALKGASVATELIVFPEAAHGFKGEDDQKAADALVGWFDKHLLAKTQLAGVWDAKGSTDSGDRASAITINGQENGFTGVAVSEDDGRETKLDVIKLDGDKVLLEINVERDGQKGVIRVTAVEKERGKLVGKWGAYGEDGTEYISGDWQASKRENLNIAGPWKVLAETSEGEKRDSSLVFEGQDGAYTGKIKIEDRDCPITRVAVKGKEVEFDASVEIDGQAQPLRVKVAEIEGGKLKGEWQIGEAVASGTLILERMANPSVTVAVAVPGQEALVGEWTAQSVLGEETKDYTLKIARDGKVLKAVLISPRSGEYAAKSVAVENGEIVMKWLREVRGEETDYEIRAKLGADGKLSGSVTAPKLEDYKGTWKAEKKAS